MRKTLKNILGIMLLFGLGLSIGGCEGLGEAIILGSPVGTVWRAEEKAKQDVQQQHQQQYQQPNAPWAGTAVVKRIQNPDGSIVFILDAERVGKAIDTNYSDKFLDATKYYKTWERNGTYGFIITYIPK